MFRQLGGVPTCEDVQFMPLNWEIGYEIALGATKPIASIHTHGLLSGVIKSSNFLIQSDFLPRLSSFETSVVGKNVLPFGDFDIGDYHRKETFDD
ncbi:unnamed protein product [Lactuca saligna]|uniref:Uncharacterized protein n=1 Tax=Lactuca saligna TaxID=75948 RepID=A0AA35Z7L5_LACSI|nr:unnamed protein product [Lactuca saligna]